VTVPTAVRWVLLAVVGLLIAVAVAVLASKLTSQRIGLASEPLDAGKILAPPERRSGGRGANAPAGDGHDKTSTAITTTTTTAATTTAPTTTPPPATTVPAPVTPTGDDSSSGRDSGREDASDDD
jgi:hypothetical protein